MPLATYTGWNLRSGVWANDGCEGSGGYVPFPRTKADRLASGDLQVVSTDHCPFTLLDKERGKDDFSKIPNGAPGIETRMSLLYDGGAGEGRISVNRFVELTATAPAKIFGLFPRKGTFAPGADADLVVFDRGAYEAASSTPDGAAACWRGRRESCRRHRP